MAPVAESTLTPLPASVVPVIPETPGAPVIWLTVKPACKVSSTEVTKFACVLVYSDVIVVAQKESALIAKSVFNTDLLITPLYSKVPAGCCETP